MMLQQIVKYINIFFLLMLVLSLAMFLVISFNPFLLNNYFKIKDIEIIGTQKTSPYKLKQLLSPNLSNLITFDKNHAKFLLEEEGWIKRANIKKVYPNTLNISIVESEPFAIFYQNQGIFLIDIDGQIISKNPNIINYKSLFIVRGEKAEIQLNRIIKKININFPEVINKISELEYIENRRWNLILSNSLLIKLPEVEEIESLKNLKKLFEDNQLLDSNIVEVDLRIKGRAIIKVDGERVRFGLEEV